ncbi:NAD-dependent epimerase/dehydratase family protein [Clostridium cochlearium]|uniref:NAD-dependent epimerase/dehydratase family protein n=1 Tax=Clostridium cochlearium TaxID=1494 RepID=A0A2X2W8I1_CLOCO|nr:NAD-dependent epimerase/dehydratase family protein [Clostridium cochlearium]NOH16441.1 NAD-dependent epimerase/dehydratase family protein [Clostridium cochlearium]SQB35747.1 NDP-sugar dehydratase or epimerase [Clostridium cochlearium]
MILVTGATGFIGNYLIERLFKDNVDVLAVGRNKKCEAYYKNKGIPFIFLDVTKKQDFEKLPKSGVDAVVHLAAVIPEHRDSNISGGDLLKINALGTWNALEYCRENNIKKFIYTTSHYEASNVKDIPINKDIVDYINKGDHVEYIISKIAGAQYVQYFNEEYGMQGIILRTTCIRGYSKYLKFRQEKKVPKSFWEKFIIKAYNSEPIEIWGDCSTHLRDHLYVKDAVECIVKAINSKTAKGRYNMASGKGITFEEEVKTIVDVFSPKDKKSKIIYKPEKKNQIDRSWVYDISKTMKDLDWQPQYSTREYLEDIKHHMEKDGYFDEL